MAKIRMMNNPINIQSPGALYMRYREIISEAVSLDWDDDYPDEITDTTPKGRLLTPQQQQQLRTHQLKKDREKFRSAERSRRERESELFDPEDDYYGEKGSRHVPKSAVGYKPFKWPMIRFGKFGQRSKVGFDAEMRREMGNVTHESGVSCFKSMPYKTGFLIREHEGRSNWTAGFDPSKLLYPWARQLFPQFVNWQKTGKPMDIFVIYGHLVSFGKNNEWLSVGADGEYLLDTAKPFKSKNCPPDQLWLHDHITLSKYYETGNFTLPSYDEEG